MVATWSPRRDAKELSRITIIIEESRKISASTKITKCISPCTETKPGWKRVSMAVDSGACENVIDAEEMVPGFEVKQTKASMSGVKYASAIGAEILNLGEVVLPVITAEGTKRRMRLQAAEVSRPLASVKRICEAGHTVVFDDTGSFILSAHSERNVATTCSISGFRRQMNLGFARP